MNNQTRLFLTILYAALGITSCQLAFAEENKTPTPSTSAVATCTNTISEIEHSDCRPIALKIDNKLTLPSKNDNKSPDGAKQKPPIFISGQKISAQTDSMLSIEGDAQVRQHGQAVYADNISYNQKTDLLKATGNVHVYSPEATIQGVSCELTLDDKLGTFNQANFKLNRVNARGSAEKINFLPRNKIEALHGTYTTCKPGNNDWYIKAGKVTLDRDQEEAKLEDGGTFVFKGVPLFYWPQYALALGDRRKSGFLIPQGKIYSSNSGFELALPYYWNIAPNYDATITPKYLSRRGLQLGLETRNLFEKTRGIFRGEFLPDDSITKKNRYSYALQQQGLINPYISWRANLQGVSDSQYFTDFSNRIAITSQVILPKELELSYDKKDTTAFIRMNKYQTLVDIANPITPPYDLLPQIQYNTKAMNIYGFDANVTIDATRFSHETLVDGWRVYAQPSLAYPIKGSAYSITPKVSLHSSYYSLSNLNNTNNQTKTIQRTIPIASLDAKLFFEKDNTTWFGQPAIQTIEPRLYYLYVPYKDQSAIPNFDSVLADFSFSQIFSENAYVGNDRIADANQVTLALTSRYLSSQTGQELVRATIARRQNLQNGRKVTLPGEATNYERASDILVGISGAIDNQFYLETGAQYNTQGAGVRNATLGIRYTPNIGNTAYLGYRYRRDEYKILDFSTQWHITNDFNMVGRVNYSINDKRYVESLIGFEYIKDCWAFRAIAQRFVTTDGKAKKTLGIQVEFNGLGSSGKSLQDTLSRSIMGYSNQKTKTTHSYTQELYE